MNGFPDYSIMSCVPKDPQVQQELSRLVPDAEPLRPYAGSVEDTCQRCGCEVMVGPRTQQRITATQLAGAPYVIACTPCAVLVAYEAGGQPDEIDVINLGNRHA